LPVFCYADGMTAYLTKRRIRIFDFTQFAKPSLKGVRPFLSLARDNTGSTPLHVAAVYGHRRVAVVLIANKALFTWNIRTHNSPLQTPSLVGNCPCFLMFNRRVCRRPSYRLRGHSTMTANLAMPSRKGPNPISSIYAHSRAFSRSPARAAWRGSGRRYLPTIRSLVGADGPGLPVCA